MSEQENVKSKNEDEQERHALIAEVSGYLDKLSPEEIKLLNLLISKMRADNSNSDQRKRILSGHAGTS